MKLYHDTCERILYNTYYEMYVCANIQWKLISLISRVNMVVNFLFKSFVLSPMGAEKIASNFSISIVAC